MNSRKSGQSGILITIIVLIIANLITYIEGQVVNTTTNNTNNSIPIPIKESQTGNFLCKDAYSSPIEIVKV